MLQNFISKLSEKEKKIFYFAIVFVVLALLDRLFLGPVLDRLKTIDNEIETQENSVLRDLRFLAYKDRIVEESNAFGKYFAEKIPDEDVVNAQFLRTVERLATQSEVTLIKSNPTETRDQKEYMEYFANLDCTGKLNDVISFMHAINTTEELLKIVKFNMSPKRGTSNEVNASMTIAKIMVRPSI